MMISSDIQNTLNKIQPVLSSTEEILDEYKGEDKLKVPELMKMLEAKHNWEPKLTRINDPFVRYHLKDHSVWVIDQGAYGGVSKRSLKEKKILDQAEMLKIKQEVRAEIEAELAKISEDDIDNSFKEPVINEIAI
jgi:hypothetical protein